MKLKLESVHGIKNVVRYFLGASTVSYHTHQSPLLGFMYIFASSNGLNSSRWGFVLLICGFTLTPGPLLLSFLLFILLHRRCFDIELVEHVMMLEERIDVGQKKRNVRFQRDSDDSKNAGEFCYCGKLWAPDIWTNEYVQNSVEREVIPWFH